MWRYRVRDCGRRPRLICVRAPLCLVLVVAPCHLMAVGRTQVTYSYKRVVVHSISLVGWLVGWRAAGKLLQYFVPQVRTLDTA